MYGTGSTIGHCTMAVWFEDELYVIEAMENVFWPIKNIQRNKYRDWIQMARNADYHVAHLSLSSEARSKFNETAAKEFFFRT
jgi:HD-like signal output (HDOD) protein